MPKPLTIEEIEELARGEEALPPEILRRLLLEALRTDELDSGSVVHDPDGSVELDDV